MPGASPLRTPPPRYVETGEDVKPIPPTRPIPHCAPRCFVPPPPSPPCIDTSPVHLVDVKSMINKQVEPIPPVEVVEGFGVPLLAYSRAIMSLNINHQQDQAQALADAITSTKRAVISYHEDSMKDLQMDIRIKNEQIRQLQDALEEQEEAAVARDSELRRELLEMKVEKERYERAWNESAGMRAEYEKMKKESDREIQRAVRVWETSEKAKLGN